MVLKVTTKTLLATGVLTAAALLAVSSPASAVPAPFTDPSISTTGDTPASGTNPAQVIATMTSNVAGVRVFSFQAAQWTFVNVIQNPGTCPQLVHGYLESLCRHQPPHQLRLLTRLWPPPGRKQLRG